MRRPALEHADDISKRTQEDIQKRFATGFLSREEVDQMHGVGGWRPMIRFVHTQVNGKQRAIEDAKKGRHNLCTTMRETIYTITDWVACRSVFRFNLSIKCCPFVSAPQFWPLAFKI